MTKKEAKSLTIEVWQYLADHPEIKSKLDLPKELYEKIRPLLSRCPLCEWVFRKNKGLMIIPMICKKVGCPLALAKHNCNYDPENYYNQWEQWDSTPQQRKEAAQGIVNIVKEWKV